MPLCVSCTNTASVPKRTNKAKSLRLYKNLKNLKLPEKHAKKRKPTLDKSCFKVVLFASS